MTRHHRTGRLAVAALALLVAASAAGAQGKGKGHGQGQARAGAPAATKTPPGLAKKGGLPPGQAKKVYRPDDGVYALRDVFGRYGYTYVRTVPYGDSRYVYYRTRDGVLRRALVSPGAERLSFSNLPAMIVREVLARLY